MHKKSRLLLIALSTFFLFSILIAQYFRLQIVEGERWSQKARAQHEIIVKEPFRRGTFFANNSLKKDLLQKEQPLVFDVTRYHLFIDPLSMPVEYKKPIATQVIDILHLQEAEEVHAAFAKESRSRRVAMWLTHEQKEALLVWWLPYARKKKLPSNSLYFVTDYKRMYPFGKLLGQVLHTIRDLKDENTSEGVPTGGLEAYFNDLLKGKQGKRKLLRSPLHELEYDELIEPCKDGADIYLTIDPNLQAIVEEELEKGVRAAGAQGGWAVMIDPSNGHILSLAQVPFFDPTEYRHFFNDPEKINESKVKAITDPFEPGSIMKPITVACALLANEELARRGEPPLFEPKEIIDVRTGLFPGRRSAPMKDLPPQKAINLEMALQKSSNIYMATLVERIVNRLGEKWYRETLVTIFGFNQKTQIELPAESIGFIPRFGKLHANGALEWSLSTPYSLAIGYNLMSTSMQMVRIYCMIANGGYWVTPTLVRKIMTAEEQLVVDNTKKKECPRLLSPEIASQLFRALKYTTKPGGTGYLAEIYGYTEAGKTGTAEKIVDGKYCKSRHLISFVGFTPADEKDFTKTRFVLMVTIDDPEKRILPNGVKCHMSGQAVAPVFRNISWRALKYLGVAPDDPHGYPKNDPRYDPKGADWMEEVAQLKELYDKLNK
jgi:cell division protein FtsI (penicillin-binding protein 3)